MIPKTGKATMTNYDVICHDVVCFAFVPWLMAAVSKIIMWKEAKSFPRFTNYVIQLVE